MSKRQIHVIGGFFTGENTLHTVAQAAVRHRLEGTEATGEIIPYQEAIRNSSEVSELVGVILFHSAGNRLLAKIDDNIQADSIVSFNGTEPPHTNRWIGAGILAVRGIARQGELFAKALTATKQERPGYRRIALDSLQETVYARGSSLESLKHLWGYLSTIPEVANFSTVEQLDRIANLGIRTVRVGAHNDHMVSEADELKTDPAIVNAVLRPPLDGHDAILREPYAAIAETNRQIGA